MTRTFIALLDESLQQHLSALIRQMARELPTLRWVDPVGIHLTLAFLGELTDEQLVQAMQATELAARGMPPFDYRLTHLGIFGSVRQPRVIWAGIDEPAGRLQQLHRSLNAQLEQRGFAIDTRPFSPHLTLSRPKAPLQPGEQAILQSFLDDQRGHLTSPLYRAKQLSVMKSELSRVGAKYTCLQNYPFPG